MAKIQNGKIVETAVEARGAERGPTVRNVLVISLCLVVVALAVLYLVYFHHLRIRPLRRDLPQDEIAKSNGLATALRL